MFGNHLNEVRNLMEMYRYQGKMLHCRRSVAEHSYFLKYSLKDINADEYLSDEVKESLEYIDFSPYF